MFFLNLLYPVNVELWDFISTHFSVIGYPDETLFLVVDIFLVKYSTKVIFVSLSYN